ncbi:MAG: YCF48-related protein [Ignavibacteria bacterium]
MKQKKLFVLLISFFAISNLYSQLYQDWKWLHQYPQGNDLRWVKMWDINTIYAIGNKGTFMKTTDGGLTWIVQHKAGRVGGIPIQVADLKDAWFFNQNTGIVVGSLGSIFRTTNGGITFDSTNNPAPTNAVITGVWFINNTTGYVISGTTNYRLMKTTDGGITWIANYGSAPPYSNPYHIRAFNENKLLVLNQLGDVCISTNGGFLWNTHPIGSQVNFYKTYFIDTNTGYACGDWGRCRYTTDGGYNWINMSGVLFDRSIHFSDIKVRSNAVYLVGTSNYVWRSTNLGITWDSLEFISPSALQPWSNSYYGLDFLSTADTMVVVGSKGSIHRVLPSSKQMLSQYLKIGSLRDIWVETPTGTVIAVGSPSSVSSTVVTHDQIMHSTNGGINWTIVSPSPSSVADFYSIDMVNNNTGYICGTKSAVYKTTNGGLTWDSLVIYNMPPNLVLSKVDFVNPTTGWIFSRYTTGNDSTIYKTTNGGLNWFKQKLNVATGSENSIYAACMLDENTGWLINSKPRPWKTTNGGISWDSTKLSDNYLAGALYDIKMINTNTGYCVGSNNKVYKTTNGGATPWINTGFSSSTIITLYTCEVFNATECIVMGTYGTAYYTSDGGTTWTNKNLGGSIDDIYGSYLINGKVYATTLLNSGIFKNSNIATDLSSHHNTKLPDDFLLYQNYPNPFNHSTIIVFELNHSSYAELLIYDVQGRVIDVVMQRNLPPGKYEVSWNGEKYSSGVYFCQLKINGRHSGLRKIVLLK